MEHIKLLIVDDEEETRYLLRTICRQLDGFELYEAVDGQDSIEKCEEIRPHIVLMDVLMPLMDGFQAAKIIKDRYPDTVVIAVTALNDSMMEENMASIGVSTYIRKPIDQDLVRLKIQNYAGAISTERKKKLLSTVVADNPFCNSVRNFKTIFTIQTIEAIMDFGVWLLARFESIHARNRIDMVLEMLYELIHQEIRKKETIVITIEESFDELFISIPLPLEVERTEKIERLLDALEGTCLIIKKIAAFRIGLSDFIQEKEQVESTTVETIKPSVEAEIVVTKKRIVSEVERMVLRESFVKKITAAEYVSSLDEENFREIKNLRGMEEEWTSWLDTLSVEGSEENFYHFANEVVSVYADAISALYEFSGLSYALVTLRTLIKANAKALSEDGVKRDKAIEYLEWFRNDLSQWVEHVFIKQDAQDIHYFDGSFFSSCMAIETIITGVEVDTGDGEIEFF